MLRACLSGGMSLSEFYESTPRDVYNFMRASKEKLEFEIEQEWDYTRHIMWAAVAAMNGGDNKPRDFIRLKRDGKAGIELTPYAKQQIAKWEAEMDVEMGIG